jgi:hypothetical protein
MTNKITEKKLEKLKIQVLKVEKQFAYEMSNAATARRSKVRQIIDDIAGGNKNEN